MTKKESSVGGKIIKRIYEFLEKLKEDKPIPAIRLEKEQTPDGPLITMEKTLGSHLLKRSRSKHNE